MTFSILEFLTMQNYENLHKRLERGNKKYIQNARVLMKKKRIIQYFLVPVKAG